MTSEVTGGPRLGAWIAGLSGLLAGAAGLAFEVLFMATAAPVLGQGRAAPFGLGAWIAGWAVGAWLAGRRVGGRGPGWMVGAGFAAAALGCLGVQLAARWPAALPGALLALLLVGTAAAQGALLVPLAGVAGVRALWAANLLGSVVGARFASWEGPLHWGRGGAALGAGAVALAAGFVGAWALRRRPSAQQTASDVPSDQGLPRAVRLAAGLGTFAMVVFQGAGVRLGAVWLGGRQSAGATILVASLLALAVGSVALAPFVRRAQAAACLVVAFAAAGTVTLVTGPGALFDLVGVDPRTVAPLVVALAIVGPSMFFLGALVPALAWASVRWSPSTDAGGAAPGSRVLAGLLLHEAWGGLAAALLFSWWLVPTCGLSGTVGVGLAALAAAVLALRRPGVSRTASIAVGFCALAAALAWRSPSAVRSSPALTRPEFQVLTFDEGADFAVSVVDDGMRGERTLLTDDFRATATGDDYLYMRALGHLPVLLHESPRRIGVLALGTGTTVGAVASHAEVERVDVFELAAEVLDAAPYFVDVNRGALEGVEPASGPDDGGRVAVHLGDGRRRLREFQGRLDVLTMEPLLPDTPAAVHLYTEEFYGEAARSLAPGGLLCQWVPPHALAPDVFDAVVAAFARAHAWSGVFLSGTQVVLVGGDARPSLASARFDAARLGDAHAQLVELGLATPRGVLARLVAEGDAMDGILARARRLTDEDPWVLYRPTHRGGEALLFLPRNLATLRRAFAPLPQPWSELVGDAGLEHREAIRVAHLCREAWALRNAARRGIAVDEPALAADPGGPRRRLSGSPFEADPEVRQLDRQVRYEASRDEGLDRFGAGDARGALDRFLRAAEVRPAFGEIHLFVAAAAARAGESDLASRALDRALERCPGALETRSGQLALRLAGESWARQIAVSWK